MGAERDRRRRQPETMRLRLGVLRSSTQETVYVVTMAFDRATTCSHCHATVDASLISNAAVFAAADDPTICGGVATGWAAPHGRFDVAGHGPAWAGFWEPWLIGCAAARARSLAGRELLIVFYLHDVIH